MHEYLGLISKKLDLLNVEKLKSETPFGIEKRKTAHISASRFYILVGCAGIEPTTNGLKESAIK
jgi:hypothetical protein